MGKIEFQVFHQPGALPNADLDQIIQVKDNLRAKGLIGKIGAGKYAGFDYGNLSIKLGGENGFKVLISASQSSSLLETDPSHFSLVFSYDHAHFSVRSRGKGKPSSETPMHWSAYEACPDIEAIIHAHIIEDSCLFNKSLSYFEAKNLPLVFSLGQTRELGIELRNLIRQNGYQEVVGMANHAGGFGLISLGQNLEEAYLKLIGFIDQLSQDYYQMQVCV